MVVRRILLYTQEVLLNPKEMVRGVKEDSTMVVTEITSLKMVFRQNPLDS